MISATIEQTTGNPFKAHNDWLRKCVCAYEKRIKEPLAHRLSLGN